MSLNAIRIAAALGLIAITADPIQAEPATEVRVDYVQPEQFTDVGGGYGGNTRLRRLYLEQLRKHIADRAAQRLSPGLRLTVSITDIDMAGSFEPWGPAVNDLRIVRDVYPPRIDLRFTLSEADGRVLKAGERKLRDPMFLTATVFYRDDPLRHEKTLIDNWLDAEWRNAGL